ncbi:MAG: RNA methyltransferase [Rhodospirillaceae bacterium]|nr:RNA methyltransferase [Rhodospirillaceae bacterium]
MRGYFGIGVEGISKSFNVGNLFRSAHAFGAGFVFTVAAAYRRRDGKQTDTSDATSSLPYFAFPSVEEMQLPTGCSLVGVEFLDDAVELPSFHHPRQAAYVMGPEGSSLSPGMLARCDHVIRIPTRFCLNVGIAGVIVMYDRLLVHGNYAARPLMPGGPKPSEMPPERFRAAPPLAEVNFAAKGGGRKYAD